MTLKDFVKSRLNHQIETAETGVSYQVGQTVTILHGGEYAAAQVVRAHTTDYDVMGRAREGMIVNVEVWRFDSQRGRYMPTLKRRFVECADVVNEGAVYLSAETK